VSGVGPALAAAVALTTSLAVLPAHAARTQIWSENASALNQGEADGIAITRSGKLFLAPRLEPFSRETVPGQALHVWSLVADRRNNIYLGTGPDGRILKFDPTGKQRSFFATREPMVTALAVAPNGDLLAGTAPGGKIYRIDPDGSGEVWIDSEHRYIWSLAVTPDGTVYASTGDRGTILKISRSGRAVPFFESDELHIVSLLPLDDGTLLAGGAGRGLVYKIDAEGNALVLYDDDLPEVTALATEPDGSVLAALVAPPGVDVKPPALRIRLPDGGEIGLTSEAIGGGDEDPGTTLHGVIEGLPPADAASQVSTRGRIVRIDPAGRATVIWRSTHATPFAMATDHNGTTLFGTGEPARLYRVEPDEDTALLATLPEGQLTGLLPLGDAVLIATSNPPATYRLDDGPAESGVFISRAFDAGGPARWGSIRWTVEPESARAEVYTRTGTSRRPDSSWSAWSPALTDPSGGAVVNPDGRYLQWRVRLAGAQSVATRLSSVSVVYEPHNRPPTIHSLRVDGDSSVVKDEATFRWSASDPDKDPVEVTLEYRPRGGGDWSPLVGSDEASDTTSNDRRVWNTEQIGEGAYEIRAVINDHSANHPGRGARVLHQRGLTVTVDRTPPELTMVVSEGTLDVSVVDALSAVKRLEILENERVRFSARPVDGICDSPQETFRFTLPETGDDGDRTGWSLRAVDAAGNSVVSELGPQGGGNE